MLHSERELGQRSFPVTFEFPPGVEHGKGVSGGGNATAVEIPRFRRHKGLEREVVVLVELPESGTRLDELLCVGLTRGTTQLVVIAPPGLVAAAVAPRTRDAVRSAQRRTWTRHQSTRGARGQT